MRQSSRLTPIGVAKAVPVVSIGAALGSLLALILGVSRPHHLGHGP
ncbi:hypothetical protein [Streptomyces aureus]|uniref:Uncharacterized protein n=1 Tax=Streptomyces aureus TaxID=193461 RepID=A0ABV4T259_9ACTN